MELNHSAKSSRPRTVNTQQKERLDCLADELEFEDAIRDMASALCHRAFAQDLHHGRSAETVIASALYTAARLEGQPYDLSEIAAVAHLDRAEIGRTYRDLSQTLDLDTEVVDPCRVSN
jgi:transcription initiation factor TFIIB